MFYIHDVIGVGDIYEIGVTFAKDILEWERSFSQYPFCTAENINEVIATEAEETCLWAPEVYTNVNQSIRWYNKLIDEHPRVHINSSGILFTIGTLEYI